MDNSIATPRPAQPLALSLALLRARLRPEVGATTRARSASGQGGPARGCSVRSGRIVEIEYLTKQFCGRLTLDDNPFHNMAGSPECRGPTSIPLNCASQQVDDRYEPIGKRQFSTSRLPSLPLPVLATVLPTRRLRGFRGANGHHITFPQPLTLHCP